MVSIDFQQEFGVNAGYVELLFERWRQAPAEVDEYWRGFFERRAARDEVAGPQAAPPRAGRAPAVPARGERAPAVADPRPAPPAVDEEAEWTRLAGLAGRIADNMSASLEVPTATSVRTLPMKVLDENRRILNDHMALRAYGKASYTHLIAFALVRALKELPALQSSFELREGKPHKRTPRNVNLGLAIDVATREGRTLLVPNIKGAEQLDFRAFHAAYEDLVRRGRDGKLEARDFHGTTASLTNPGGFGTHLSVPRLMKGQGLIVATGSIGVPTGVAGMSGAILAQLAIGPVMTMTSTYDHRVIQGAESGLFLRRVEELLQGEDGFYESIFASMRVPWRPWKGSDDVQGKGASRDEPRDAQARVSSLINAYRVRGCRLADLDPLEYRPDPLPSLDPSFYGFTIWDLDRRFQAGGMCGQEEPTLRDILKVLRQAYCQRRTIEFMHIVDRGRKMWLRERVETPGNKFEFDHEHRVRILTRLYQAQNFERFLQARYPGNKRFSLEGADVLIPALAELIDQAGEHGVERVVVGMAHRGRLNVLVNILRKSYAQVFREFEGVLLPLSAEGSGDVKYHLGQRGTYRTAHGKEIEVVLSANPSHLEAVDPVVCGMVRGYQDALGDLERKRVLGVLVHGDAAFSGQGVVAETFNMSKLRAFDSGGTVHLVVNNQIGFTAGPRDLRSTYYCTDIAKSVQAPILHANGDFPESVLRCVHLAAGYQREFQSDVVIDVVCYRRWGHNEGDEPAFTQPVLYRKIRSHPTVVDGYVALLQRRGAMSQEECEAIGARFDEELREALHASQETAGPELPEHEVLDLEDDDPEDWTEEPSPATGVRGEALVSLVDRANRIPEGHTTHPNLLRQLRRREQMVRGDAGLDWGCAELLAFGSLLEQGISIRLEGQDSRRGTFSQRHAVIRDQVTEADHIPLAELAPKGTTFEVWDSLLSEEAALAYEYGYSVARPQALVLWEAQFGDFVNGAQIPIDQFLVAGQAKWKQESGVVLLLPHGYDGQGPEHSSARIERFLTLCSEGNLSVANCTTSAQYFHLLRRQGTARERRPLVVFTPKSLLRDKRAASDVRELTEGRFREVIDDPRDAGVRRVVLCSGKVYYDLEERRDEQGRDDVALVRLEQLYPFPRRALLEALARRPGSELVWAQEEPRNMGPWTFVMQRLGELGHPARYAGRPMSSSPATGSYRRHMAEQEHLVRRALGERP